MLRILVVGLVVGLTLSQTGCGCCCRRMTNRPASPPCCGAPGVVAPAGVLPPGPPATAGFPPASGLPASYGR